MQHYVKPSCAKNMQYATKFFNSEVKHTWISTMPQLEKRLVRKKTILYFNLWYSARLPADDGTEVIYITEGISTLLM